ncbi:hypothetical protein RhiirA4_452958 [Rhizophagus irregularis]|uniref:Uncharacterized protein n=1 Tax=Rhizophagus irregularis TaxID=588596 RepID=A0A2I1FZA6_9GLOM|nr:hypothetical protein RhiirA4_452958 [Rhizophagus irregularis]
MKKREYFFLKLKCHPESYYFSRKVNHSTKLNEMLEQEELSDKFVIMEDNNNDMSESLANCVIKD